MIVRMCGRCQEEIEKERKKNEEHEKELAHYKKLLANALGINVERLEKEITDKT